MITDREESLIQQMIDGELLEATWPEVRALLESSEEARRIYCSHARIHGRLAHMRRARMTIATPAVPVDFIIQSQRRQQLRWAAIAAAALVLVSALVMRLLQVREPESTATLQASADSRFSVTHRTKPSNPPEANILHDGSRLHLDQGVVELEFASGVRSVVRGPAEFSVVHPGELRLDHGTGWFFVPPNASGFRVSTPRAVITDFGTEFGVITRPDLADSAHLFEGVVEVRTLFGAEESATLRGREAKNITLAGQLQTTEPRREDFYTDLPHGLPSLYWSFDEASPSAWRAAGTMPEAAWVKGSPSPTDTGLGSGAGRFGNALHGKGGTGWATIWPGIAGNAPRTLTFWLRLPPRGDYIHPLAGWGNREAGDKDTTLSSFFAYAETVDEVTVAGASIGAYWIKGATRIDDDRWHHLAITASGLQLEDGRPDLRLYIDGREETIRPFWTDGITFSQSHPLRMATATTHPESRPLSVLTQLAPGQNQGHGFPASIDELRVVEGTLEAADIELLYRKNIHSSDGR